MNRREFIKSGSVAAATVSGAAISATEAAATPLPVSAQETSAQIVLKVASPWSDDIAGPGDLCRRVLGRITTLSSGRIQFEHVAAPSNADAQPDIVFGSEHEHLDRHPAFAYFAGLPGASGLEATAFKGWLETAGGQALWRDLASAFNYVPLACGHLGENPPLWSHEPITTAADLRNRRIAIPGLAASVASGMGARPITSADNAAEPVELFASGDADIVETGGLYFAMQSNIHKHARTATTNAFSRGGTTLAVRIALNVWEHLKPGDQAVFESAASELFATSVTEARMQQAMIRKALETGHGITFHKLDDATTRAMDEVARAVMAHTASFDDAARRIDASAMAFRSLSSAAFTS
ncbi:MAG: hypothetical protein AAFV45_10625 [Pseudomonadota bacterium]